MWLQWWIAQLIISWLGCVSYAEYLGCYQDLQGELFKDLQQNLIISLTPDRCIALCESKDFPYAGLKSRIICLCNTIAPASDLLIGESQCNLTCVGDNSSKCGGEGSVSVYTTKLAIKVPVSDAREPFSESFVGCYKDNVNDRLLSGFFKEYPKNNSPELCRNVCFRLGYLYAAVEYGGQCFCGDAHPPPSFLRDTSQCSTPCPGNSDMKCGGRAFLSVYSTGITDIPILGKKLGCFDDEDPRVLREYKIELEFTNSPQRCMNLCRSLGFHYAGVEYGIECFCGHSVNANTSRDSPDAECDRPCPGDPFQTCGNNWELSVYRTGLSDPEPITKKIACVSERAQPLQGFRQDFSQPIPSQQCANLCYRKGFFYSAHVNRLRALILIAHHNIASTDGLVARARWYLSNGGSARRGLCSPTQSFKPRRLIKADHYSAIAQLHLKENYIGCFEDGNNKFEGFKLKFENHLTPEKCSAVCFNKGFLFSGTKNKNECLCSDKSAAKSLVKTADEECSSPCSGDTTKRCGGEGKISIYSTGITDIPVISKLLGCFKDEIRPRALDGHKTDLDRTNSPRRCLNYCLALGFMFAGVEYQKECFCGDSRPNSTLDVPDSQCNSVCSGDSSQTCGGGWRMEVYRTGYSLISIDPMLPLVSPKPQDVCEPSRTVVNGQNVCRGAEVFYDNFKTQVISDRWQHIVKIADAPDYEFVTFTSEPANSFIRDGKLVIKPTLLSDTEVKEGSIKLDKCTGLAGTRECDLTAFSYNILPPVKSARLHTLNSFHFRYGTVEIRARLPAGDWIVPELWLVPRDQSYGKHYLSGKIRVALSRGNRYLTHDGRDVGSSVLESGVVAGPEGNVTARAVVSRIAGSWSSVAHTFTLVWTPDNLLFYVDGQSQQALLPPSGRLAELLGFHRSDVPLWFTGSRIAPFDTDFYLSLGLSVGGSRAFPDGCISRNREKPWRNFKLKAMLNFWLNKDTWRPTWEEDKTSLEIEYVKVIAL